MSTISSVRFEPIQLQEGEILQPGVTKRPALVLNEDTPEVNVGRNVTTGIDDWWVHRNAATLRLTHDGKIWLQYGSPQQKRYKHAASLSVNGKPPQRQQNPQYPRVDGGMCMELHHGDVIAVEGRREPVLLRYSYQVAVVTSCATALKTAAASPITRSTTASTALAPSLFEPIGNEAMCPICMEIQVRSRSVVPCGHGFCLSCITPLPPSCAICRMQVQSQIPNLQLDNIIWTMIEAQALSSSQAVSDQRGAEFFDMEDIQSYLKRSGKTLPTTGNSLPTTRRHNHVSASFVPMLVTRLLKTRKTDYLYTMLSLLFQTPLMASQQSRRGRYQPQTPPTSSTTRRKRNRVESNMMLDPGQGTSLANAICLN